MSLVKQNQGYLCPTCGCSLVRLGIDPLSAPSTDHQGQEYRFCCEGCVTLFLENPQLYVEEIKDVVICPICLGEKTRGQALCVNINGESIYFSVAASVVVLCSKWRENERRQRTCLKA